MRRFAPCLIFLLAISMPGVAWAQAEIRASVEGYAPVFFAGSQPSSALDMVGLVPGFRLLEGNATVRGYSGGVGNVLIDGQPPASKQDTLGDILKRIPADSVDRIELVHPGAAGIDMQGYPLLVNVVRKVSNAPRGRAEFEFAAFRHGVIAPRAAGEFSLGTTDVLDISAAVYRAPEVDSFGYGMRNDYAGNGTVKSLSRYNQPKVDDIWTIIGSYRQPLLGGAVHASGLYSDQRTHSNTVAHFSFPSVTVLGGPEREFHTASEAQFEYDHDLWSGAEAQVITIRRGKSERTSQESNVSGPDNLTFRHTDASETILRGLARQRATALTLEGGVEGAINTLANHNSFKVNGINQPLPTASVAIEEDRAELFGTATWHPWRNFTLESSLRYEMSELTQSGDSNLKRSLSYLKPHILASWQPTVGDEIRLLYEREAGQLDFSNFISQVSVSTGIVSSGNENLVPYTLWRSQLAWEHRFAAGSVVLTGRREEISDTVDRVAVYTPQGVFDAAGNLGSGHREQAQLDLIQPLDWTGQDGFTLQGTAIYTTSSVVDPTVGRSRRISNDSPLQATVTLTEDVPSLSLRWGVSYKNNIDTWSYRFNEIQRNNLYPRVEAFAEYKPRPDWLIRLFGRNLSDTPVMRSRLDYVGSRSTGVVSFFEPRPLNFGPSIGINVQRTF